METSTRGFSFMPNTKVEEINMQYIESEDLERTWKLNRRERLKQQEQKIWEEFVKEKDILSFVCEDDPYQFLLQLPDSCLKELMEIELSKMKSEVAVEQPDDVIPAPDDCHQEDVAVSDEGSHPNELENAEEQDYHTYVYEEEEEQTDGEDEVPASPLASLDTVREVPKPPSPDKVSCKSCENVQSVAENSSVHSAKIKDLRTKIKEEILAIITTLEQRNVEGIDLEELTKMCRRSAEFSTRFNRIHLYQLQRQIHDVKRNCDVSLPFARHTQLQSQMVRVVSLHQNLFQALQCVTFELVKTQIAIGTLRLTRLTCLPNGHYAQCAVYDDDMVVNCAKLEEAVTKHEAKVSEYMISSVKNTNTSRSRRSNNSKKSSVSTWSKIDAKTKSDAQSRLSMYSLETLRGQAHAKSLRPKDSQTSGTSKARGMQSLPQRSVPSPAQHKVVKKSPRSRRPQMRGDAGRGRSRLSDARVRTLVECTSNRASCETTPRLEGSPTPKCRNETPHSGNKSTRPCEKTPRLNMQPKMREEKSAELHNTNILQETLINNVVRKDKLMEEVEYICGKNFHSPGKPSPDVRGKSSPRTPRSIKVNENGAKGVSLPAPTSKHNEDNETERFGNQIHAAGAPSENNKIKVSKKKTPRKSIAID
ncbi:hypothetical protein ACJJTC_014668 [Scirpophaga incertulas]